MRRLLTAIVAATTLVLPFWQAGAGDFAYIKLTSVEEEPLYFIEFSARGKTFTGHASVIWFQLTTELGISHLESWGLYPEDEKKAFLGEVSAKMADEALSGSSAQVTDKLLVKVDRVKYQMASKIRAEWQTETSYKLAERDRVEFLAKIAAAIGIKAPHRNLSTLSPQMYVRELVKLNKPESPHEPHRPIGLRIVY